MTGAVVLALLVLVAIVVPALVRSGSHRRWAAASTTSLEVGPLGVRRELADGRLEEVHWDEIVEVDVVVAERGPHAGSGGVVVLYADSQRGVVVPIDQIASSGLAEQLGRLPGFRIDVLAAALERPAPAHTTCWSVRAAPPSG